MARPRIYCDFNDRIDHAAFGLRCRGTVDDLARQQIHLAPGLAITLYDQDAFDNGEPAWIVADAVVVDVPGVGFIAEVEPGSFRWEPRREHAARIHWSESQVRAGLPSVTRITDPCRILDDSSSGEWSLVCNFRTSPLEQGGPSLATVQFLFDHAPHGQLKPSARLALFERATQDRAIVEILD